jgi:hypothetical protein
MRHSPNCGCFGKSKDAAIKHWPQLHELMQGVPKKNRKIFKTCNLCFINFVGECCKAVLCEIIPLTSETYTKLKPNRKDLLYLANENIPLHNKRARLVKQGGGFLSLILPTLASALFGYIGNLISKIVT